MKPSRLPFLIILCTPTVNIVEAYLMPRRLPQRRHGATRLFAIERSGSGNMNNNNNNNSEGNDSSDEFRKPTFKTSLDDEKNYNINDGTAGASAGRDYNGLAASTRTVNERLMAELQQAADKEKYGSRSELTKKFSLDIFQSTKTDEERRLAIEEARDLNGVNPVVTGVASMVALSVAFGLWIATTKLGVFFATHPVDSDWYVVQRSTAVFRNAAMGLVSLAAGFCGVTGLGIGLLTGRVALGVARGELDPTPLPAKPGEEVQLPNVWDLMLNKKPNRRSGGKDLFGP